MVLTSTKRRTLGVCVALAVVLFIVSSLRLGQEDPPESDSPTEQGSHVDKHRPEYQHWERHDLDLNGNEQHGAGTGALSAEAVRNISKELTSARLVLQQIQETMDAAKAGMAKFMQDLKQVMPTAKALQSEFVPAGKSEMTVSNDPKTGEIRPHMAMHMCLDGIDEKTGAIPFPCHGKGGNQYWRWSKSGQLSSTGLCLDANGVEAKGAVKLTPCRATNPGQHFEYSYHGVWYPAGPLVSTLHNLCLAPPLPDAADQSRITLDPCDGSCRQLWMVNAPLFNGSTPIRRMSRIKKPAVTAGPAGARLLCWVMTNPANHAVKARTVAETWARHCDTLLFVSTEQVPGVTTLVVDLQGQKEARDFLWKKSQIAWMHVYSHYLNSAEWFLRADDDTYLLIDNLRQFLAGYSHNDTHFFGRKFVAPEDNATFYSGGPGTVMSRNTLRLLGEAVEREAPDTIFSNSVTFADDVEIALSLARIGILTEDTRDVEGRARFISLGLGVERTLTRTKSPKHWFWNYDRNALEGKECCSKRWIGTHYVSPEGMRQLEDMHSVGCEGAGKDPY